MVTRTAVTGPITATRRLSDVYQPSGESVPLADLVGAYLHINALERFRSDQYGDGVRIHARIADANGSETSEEILIVTFAYRIRMMAVAIVGDAMYAPFTPPLRCQVQAFGTVRGQSYDLVDA
jgi:hypothetical protein